MALIELTPREADSLFDRLDDWYATAAQPLTAAAIPMPTPAPTPEHSLQTSVDGSPLHL